MVGCGPDMEPFFAGSAVTVILDLLTPLWLLLLLKEEPERRTIGITRPLPVSLPAALLFASFATTKVPEVGPMAALPPSLGAGLTFAVPLPVLVPPPRALLKLRLTTLVNGAPVR